MTEVELLAAANDIITRMDHAFEFWLSSSFAVVVSFFFIGERAKISIKLLVAFLYGTSSILAITRWWLLTGPYFSAGAELSDLGSTLFVGASVSTMLLLLYSLIFVIGTIAVISYVFLNNKIFV